MKRTHPVTVNLSAEEIAALDRHRDDRTRGGFLRWLLLRFVAEKKS